MHSYTCPHCGTDYFDGASDCDSADCPGNDPARQKELQPHPEKTTPTVGFSVSGKAWTTLLEAASHLLQVIETDEQPNESDLYPLRDAVAKLQALPPDPENMNNDRAEWAAAALRHFQCATGTDYDDALTDLLGDLMHWCDRNNGDFERALSMARMHYEAETTEAETMPDEATE